MPALTVARICGSGAEAVAVGAELILAGVRHDRKRPFLVVGGAESMQYPFSLYGQRGRKVGEAVQKYGPLDVKGLAPGTQLQDALLMSLYDPGAQMAMANTAEELGRRYRITREEADRFAQVGRRGISVRWVGGAIYRTVVNGDHGISEASSPGSRAPAGGYRSTWTAAPPV